MEPAGWATVAASMLGMFGAIVVAMIERAKNKPRAWNGQERRVMEKVASEAIHEHITRCPNKAELLGAIKNQGETLGREIGELHKDVRELRSYLEKR